MLTILPSHSVPETVFRTLTKKIDMLDVNSVRNLEPKIIRVPVDIKKDHEDAYEPRMLFIGPYHRKPSPMEEVKLLYLMDLLSRDEQHNMLSHYIEEIFNDVGMARMEYSDPIELSIEEFVEKLVVDGCFIIEFLLKRAEGNLWKHNSSAIFDVVATSPTLRRDLLLLENQIPFFILEKFFKMSNYDVPNFPKATTTLIDFALSYLTRDSLTKDKLMEVHRKEENIYHLLHLSYLCLMVRLYLQETTTGTNLYKDFKAYISRWLSFIRYCVHTFPILFLYCIVHVLVLLFLWRKPSWSVSSERNDKKPRIRMLHTATELREAGVTFEKKKTSNNYLDVSFDKLYFKIPQLPINENTNSVFRNFLAFEQSCPKVGNTFTSYVVLMANLIDTSSDVEVLKRKGVLESTLGSDDDVVRLFSQMRSSLYFDFRNHYLKDMFQDVNNYCNRKHIKWRAKVMHEFFKLRHDHFPNTWACLSIAGGVLLLGVTVVQTAYTVRSSYR